MSIDNNVFDCRTQWSENGTKKPTTTNGSETFGSASNDHSAFGVFRQLVSNGTFQVAVTMRNGVSLGGREIDTFSKEGLTKNEISAAEEGEECLFDISPSDFDWFDDPSHRLAPAKKNGKISLESVRESDDGEHGEIEENDDELPFKITSSDLDWFENPSIGLSPAKKNDLTSEVGSNTHNNGNVSRSQSLNISLQSNNDSQGSSDQNLKAAVEKFKKQNPKGKVVKFVKTLSPSDAGKTVMGKLFNVLSDAGQKQGIWNSDSDITSSDKFINTYVNKIKSTLELRFYCSLGSDLERFFEVIPYMVQDFSSPEDVKDKIENLFQNLNIGNDFSNDKKVKAIRAAELIFTLTNLSRYKVSIKNIDLRLVAQVLNTHIFVKEEGKEEYIGSSIKIPT